MEFIKIINVTAKTSDNKDLPIRKRSIKRRIAKKLR